MVRTKKMIALLLTSLLLAGALTPVALANSAEPPMLTVIVEFAPKDLTISIRFADGSVAGAVPLQRTQKAWETYYRVFRGLLNVNGTVQFEFPHF